MNSTCSRRALWRGLVAVLVLQLMLTGAGIALVVAGEASARLFPHLFFFAR